MTNLQKQLGGISVNGRVRYFDRITDLKRAGRAAWTVVHKGTGGTYRIEGGRHAGGTRRDWFLDGPFTATGTGQSIHCTSLTDALRVLENL